MMYTCNKLWSEAAIKANKAFVTKNFLGAINTVLVQYLTHDGGSLILHTESHTIKSSIFLVYEVNPPSLIKELAIEATNQVNKNIL